MIVNDETPMLSVPAIRIRQGPGRELFSFAVDGKRLPDFATISRVRRDPERGIVGYQRPEVLSHIAEIRAYLETERPLLPNSIVVAFDPRVIFKPLDGGSRAAEGGDLGTLLIPLDPNAPEEERPGWIVDGQQRSAAIREAAVESFPVFVTAFIAHSVQEQTEQFILVNSTKPLQKGLIYELLPGTDVRLPSTLQRRRFPAYLLERLNREEDSPFCGLIQTPTNPTGVIKDNSILKMLEHSLTEGALYHFRDSETGEGDAEAMLTLIKAYWSAVSDVFQDAWGLPPRRSRLMHGAGIVGMGFLMDDMAERQLHERTPTREDFRADLLPLQHLCRWTSGSWDFGLGRVRRWDEIQNTSKDILLLAGLLLTWYDEGVQQDQTGWVEQPLNAQ